MIGKITPYRLQLVIETVGQYCYYKTLGTNVITVQCILPTCIYCDCMYETRILQTNELPAKRHPLLAKEQQAKHHQRKLEKFQII